MSDGHRDDAARDPGDPPTPPSAPSPEEQPASAAPRSEPPSAPAPPVPAEPARLRRIVHGARELNEHDRLLGAVARLRRRLPGDDRLGDPLSTADGAGTTPLTRRIARLAGQQTGGVVHELGMGALQVWQAAAESNGRGRGTVDLTVLFTDLVGFSHWALEAGDQAALLLLREVAGVLEPEVERERGTVVKWLGDGMMAVFREPLGAVRAVEASRARLDQIEIAGYQPRIRAGIHLGRPRRVGGDYLGVDVNIAARVADAAAAGELLASDRAVAALDPERVTTHRKRRFRAKGVPPEVTVCAVRSR